jgi:RNA polymerase sigma-70 factor (ECF subfamily)
VDDLTRLLLHARDGDRIALAAAIRVGQADVWRLCAHLVDRDEADDLTQDTLVRAIRALPAYRAEASGRTWLLAIARRACADALRSRQRRRRLTARFSLFLAVPSEALPAEDRSGAWVDQVVARLADERREAFVLTQLLGLSYEEAAAACDVPIGTIRSRVARARRDLVEWTRAGEDTG